MKTCDMSKMFTQTELDAQTHFKNCNEDFRLFVDNVYQSIRSTVSKMIIEEDVNVKMELFLTYSKLERLMSICYTCLLSGWRDLNWNRLHDLNFLMESDYEYFRDILKSKGIKRC